MDLNAKITPEGLVLAGIGVVVGTAAGIAIRTVIKRKRQSNFFGDPAKIESTVVDSAPGSPIDEATQNLRGE